MKPSNETVTRFVELVNNINVENYAATGNNYDDSALTKLALLKMIEELAEEVDRLKRSQVGVADD